METERSQPAACEGKAAQSLPSELWSRAGHALLPTLFLACLLIAAKHASLLDWLRVTTTMIVAAGIESEPLDPKEAKSLPIVVTIDDAMFEAHFKGTSPLDRSRLAELIRSIHSQEHCPSVLAIDLDLSYGAASDPPAPMEKLLTALQEAAHDPSCKERKRVEGRPAECGTRIALITPFLNNTSELKEKNEAWKRIVAERLSPCFRFADSNITRHRGSALYFAAGADGLGNVAFRLANGGKNHVEARFDGEVAVAHASADQLINTRLLRQIRLDEHEGNPSKRVILQRPAAPSGELPKLRDDMKDRVVFLGGSWGHDDKHGTAIGSEMDGVAIHAAIFDSLTAPVPTGYAEGLLIDLGVGVAFGAIFSAIWKRYSEARAALNPWPVSAAWPPWLRNAAGHFLPTSEVGRYRFYLRWLRCLLALIAAIVISMAVSVVYSVWRLGAGAWIDPAVMIVGMAIHAVVESRAGHEASHGSTAAIEGGKTHGPCRSEALAKWDGKAAFGFLVWAIRSLTALGVVVFALWMTLVPH